MTIQYKRVAAGLYTDSKIASFGLQPPHPTTFMIWLLTGPVFGVLPGCASIGRYGIAERSGWSPDQIDAMMGPLVNSGIMQFDASTPFIYFPKALSYNEPKSPLNVTSWASDWRKLPNCVLKERAWHALNHHCNKRDEGVVFDKKKVRNARNSFKLAFGSIEKPPESPILPEKHSYEHRSEHSSFTSAELNNNNNNNNNSNRGSENPTLKASPDNVSPIVAAKLGGDS